MKRSQGKYECMLKIKGIDALPKERIPVLSCKSSLKLWNEEHISTFGSINWYEKITMLCLVFEGGRKSRGHMGGLWWPRWPSNKLLAHHG